MTECISKLATRYVASAPREITEHRDVTSTGRFYPRLVRYKLRTLTTLLNWQLYSKSHGANNNQNTVVYHTSSQLHVTLLHSRLRHRQSAASAIGQLPPTTPTFSHRAFSADGPMAWNSLSDCLRDPECSPDCFWWDLKTFRFWSY